MAEALVIPMANKFHLVRDLSPASHCPYRLLDPSGKDVVSVNQFLEAQCLRGLSLCSLRIYAYDLLNFARWWLRQGWQLSGLNEHALLDYVRFQLDNSPRPSASTINHRLTVVRCLYRFHFGHNLPGGPQCVQSSYKTRSPLGYGKPGRHATTLRLKQPRRIILPLTPEQVASFWHSFRTFRDLSLIALMLLDGLRSAEVRRIQLHDVDLLSGQLRVCGKGRKERIVPLPPDALQALQWYLHMERPQTAHHHLFVSLKGPRRGQPLTEAGLRSLFRHHRRKSQVPSANPHRFRHTFGSDMVSAGVSLPALMHLMGHASIHTTMLYVELSPQEIWRQYQLAVLKRAPLAACIQP
ncbi:MAG: tyrosine-type recombinase/integrase [Deltaproteobacteria bacterium]|nr:tyrosine-type recombinase/integrase [Deltaproteobacteria bacterium]